MPAKFLHYNGIICLMYTVFMHTSIHAANEEKSSGPPTAVIAIVVTLFVGICLGSCFFVFTMCQMKQRPIYYREGISGQDHIISARLRVKTSHSPVPINSQMRETVENMLYRYNCTSHNLNTHDLESNVTSLPPAPSLEHVYEDLESSYASAQQQRRVHYDLEASQCVQVHVHANSFREAGQPSVSVVHTHAHRQHSLPTLPEVELMQPSTGKPPSDSLWYRTINESRSESLCDLSAQSHSHNDPSSHSQPLPYEEAPEPHLKSCSSKPRSQLTLCPLPSPPPTASADITAGHMLSRAVSRHSESRQIVCRTRTKYRSSLSTIPSETEFGRCGLAVKRTISDPYMTATDLHLAGAGTVFSNSCRSLSPFTDTSSEFSVPSVDYCDQPTLHVCHRCKHHLPCHVRESCDSRDSSRRAGNLAAHRLTYVHLEDEEGESNA